MTHSLLEQQKSIEQKPFIYSSKNKLIYNYFFAFKACEVILLHNSISKYFFFSTNEVLLQRRLCKYASREITIKFLFSAACFWGEKYFSHENTWSCIKSLNDTVELINIIENVTKLINKNHFLKTAM